VEIPQESAEGAFRGIGTDSPVFLPALGGQKNAPKKYPFAARKDLCGFLLFFFSVIMGLWVLVRFW
jgi:hypothetical protein